ncbi:hypothetical protein F5Y09DRAFT_52967 [Xylaria sp. FL1042]|nr:hypothetical protein F5Y09DRAFT_52967 [Xylaria sp. FL1042]
MDLPFTTLDVFTTKQLQGNPLAVVRVSASLRDRLTQPLKLKIAQEFNLSETVFLHDETSKSGPKAREVDIFTIEQELPFAGHPTIGTATLVREHLADGGGEDVQTLLTKAGPIDLAPSPRGIQARIPHDVHLHKRTLNDLLVSSSSADTVDTTISAAVKAGLHPHPTIAEAELSAPVFSIVNGMAFALVRLPSLDLLREVKPLRLDFGVLGPALLDEGWRESFVARYYYVDVDDVESGEEGEEGVKGLRTRMVEMGFEDPATGSAATALGAYLTLTRERKGTKFLVTQGVEMGRKSVISVETTLEGGEIGEVYLGGTAVVVMQGTLRVDG